jgi:hypothetical protein
MYKIFSKKKINSSIISSVGKTKIEDFHENRENYPTTWGGETIV